jgi:nucleoside-diphosphate-sugar epimerase
MKKAIITGSTGLVGMAVARYFSSLGIEVLCLGTKKINPEEISRCFGDGSIYHQLAMNDICSLADRIDLLGWFPGAQCVFFNFAWRGLYKLTDGSFEEQMNNAVNSAEAVRMAKKLGCIKFVNAGTLEETYLEEFQKEINDQTYKSSQTDYALAKLASRDMCKMVAYIEKISYVHTRLSVPLSLDLSRGSYVAATLKKIAQGASYEGPTNKQLFDIVFVDDVAKAYHLIGLRGKNKADYFIGTSRPFTLGQYFEMFERFLNKKCPDKSNISVAGLQGCFDTKSLYRDTGFVAATRFPDMFNNFLNP